MLFALGILMFPLLGLSQELPIGIISLGNSEYFSPHVLVVDKQQRKLSVWKQEFDSLKKVLEVPSDMGKKQGNKSSTGDERTPESIYFFEKILEGGELPYEKYGVKAFTMNYPNLFDQRIGKTGYGIWLHAIPDTETLERGSKGCVVVRNDTIKNLSQYISLKKTPILIFEQLSFQTNEQRLGKLKDVEQWIAAWTKAWQSKDIENYIKFYDEDFHSMKMGKNKWKIYKNELNQKYASINVQFYSPVILRHGDNYIVKALQAYKSDQHEDFGEKTLYLTKTSGELKIMAEEWTPVSDSSVLRQIAACCTSSETKKQ